MRSLLARDKDKLLRKNQLSRSLRRRLPVPKDSGTQGQGLAPGEQMRQWGGVRSRPGTGGRFVAQFLIANDKGYFAKTVRAFSVKR